ncbi:protein-tyrosine phosphatase-like protein, partial [Haematococcus lacustris]
CYCIDDQLLYEPFFADFGPLNLGKAYRFYEAVATTCLLQEADRSKKRLYYYCGPHAQQRSNAAVLIGIYQVVFLNRTAEEAYRPLQAFKPYMPFRDASCGVSTFHLTVWDVIKGIQKARDVSFIDWSVDSTIWNCEEYEHYEQVENGDLNWIVPGKLVAFSGPAARGNEIAGYRLHTPEDYWDYWRKKGVTAIVRLNKKVYDRKRFTDGGFRHYDLYFPDGSCPSEAILLKFLEIAESEPGALAIHCKAGLGRTGVLICCYCMKHFRFTVEEVIGYIRVCRPGSVIGPQQNFLRDVEARMWHEGDMWRAQRGITKPHLTLGVSQPQPRHPLHVYLQLHLDFDPGPDATHLHPLTLHLLQLYGLVLGLRQLTCICVCIVAAPVALPASKLRQLPALAQLSVWVTCCTHETP